MGESPINLGRLIKNARLEAGLTQDNLATQLIGTVISALIGTVISAILRFCVEIRPLPRTTTVFAPRTTIPIRTFRQHRHCEVYF